MALTEYSVLVQKLQDQIQTVALFMKGQGVDNYYALEVDQTTGAIPVSGSFTLALDKNYGVVGANTLRTAAQIGNATGAALFGAGSAGPQVLRVTVVDDQATIPVEVENLPTTVDVNTGSPTSSTIRTVISSRSEAAATPLATRLSDGSAFLGSDFGAATGALRVASILGNATAVADFGSGVLSAQTLRVVLATDQPTVPVSIAGTVTISGTVAATQSGTWNINNVSGTVSLPTGAATEATLATRASEATLATRASETTLSALNTKVTLGSTAAATAISVNLSTRQEAAATPVATRPGDGTNFGLTSNLTAAQQTLSTGNALPVEKAIIMGWDGSNHREVAVDGSGNFVVSTTAAGLSKVDLIYYDYGGGSVTTSAYTQILASTASASKGIQIFDSSGQGMILAVGGVGAEVDTFYIEPGGPGYVTLAIASTVRLSLKAKTATASVGFFMATTLN